MSGERERPAGVTPPEAPADLDRRRRREETAEKLRLLREAVSA